MAENVLQLFKPTDITVVLNNKKEKLVYDMYAVLELEKMYGGIDIVFKMLFGKTTDTYVVKVADEEVDIATVTVDGTPLQQHLITKDKANEVKATMKDTINILWVGLLHSHTKRDDDGEIISCDITKNDLIKTISFKNNLTEINTQIVSAIIRDLIAPDNVGDIEEELKN